MGQPGGLAARHHPRMEQTRGTETSQYPQEKKETIDSLSSGERKGKSLNPCARGHVGVVGDFKGDVELTGSTWEGTAQRVKLPYRQDLTFRKST